ncbi:MAG: 16S rRNA (cytidine(1402)-2'-O)-methyltransferase [Wenzhouxiangellaceae bacterium]
MWVVATPIGHLDDLSERARRCLSEADVIAAEDTRTSRKLLPPRKRPPEWIALHEHNEADRVAQILARIGQGARVALVSDAGTPLISDPGYRLVREAHRRGLPVQPVPGPCAAIAALCCAGLPTDRFRFEGFLPPRAGARKQRLTELQEATETLVFYVPARDLIKVIVELEHHFGADREAVLARELTKRFETIRLDTLGGLRTWLESDPDQRRGEAVLVVRGRDPQSAGAASADARRVAAELAAELPPARAARLTARLCGIDRRTAFALVEALGKD